MDKPFKDVRLDNYDEVRATNRLRNPLHPGPRMVKDKNAPIGWKRRIYGMTPNQLKFAKVLLETFDKMQAIEQSYPGLAPSSRSQMANKLLDHPIVRPFIVSRLIEADAPGLIVRKLVELLESQRPHNSPKGEVMMVSDNGVQLKSVIELAKLMGVYPPSEHHIEKKSASLHFDGESLQVIRFVSETGRYPTPEEKEKLESS